MRNVFVETNWVVACASPKHLRLPAALELAEMAQHGEIRLYLPSICISEAQHPIRSKYQPRAAADSIRKYLAWAMVEQHWDRNEVEIVRRTLDRYESGVAAELDQLKGTLDEFRNRPGIEVFPLDEQMLQRSVELSSQQVNLKPYYQAILAALLVRAEQLRAAGELELCFCELDGDLQPWDKNGRPKQPLTSLYDQAQIWVYGDFAMKSPERPLDWPPDLTRT
jgi:predicted nucleic acid-binding protein